jgi:serine/threonine protein kinase/tetratricopeptide (TPR) repeat protein
MQPDQRRIDSIFLAAAEKATAAERAAYLDVVCASDPELRERVERLLAAQSKVSRFLEAPAPALISTLAEPPVTERPGTVVGPYRLLEQIGEGGMGTVWMAEQTEPIQRRVAVKVVKEGMDSRQVLARFEAERQALALMEHPNIAKVLDAGKTPSGRPYFVMELVKGQPITGYCDGIRLGVRERLELFGDVCRAVQHAHQKGIIHRDLKPSNVLVAPYDGKPVVKVIDFGVAKATGQRLTDKTLFTGFGALVGTPEYMSPEQAEVNNQDIDTRSDIYALGVLLYELLTGSTPLTRQRIREAALLEVLRVIREEEPPRPSTRLSESRDSLPSISAQRRTEPVKLTRLVRGELDWIVMKALEKDRNRRYETANGFAADVQRYLHDEPVLACPPRVSYRLRKFVRRNRGLVLALSTILVLLAAGIVGTTTGLVRALAAERQALTERDSKTRALQAETKARVLAMDALRQLTRDVVQHQLARRTALTAEDRHFLRDIQRRYEEFAALPGDDAEQRAIRAEGHLHVASVRDGLGEEKEAEASVRMALALYQGLVAEFPAEADYRHWLARSHNLLGTVLSHAGRLNEAETANAAALALRKQLAEEFPRNTKFRREFAAALCKQALTLQIAGRLTAAEPGFTQAVALQKQLVAEFLNIPAYRRELALSYMNLGTVLKDTGRLRKAETAYGHARALQKQLVDAHPDWPEFRQDLALSYLNLGLFLQTTSRPKEAEAAYADAITLSQQLAADFPLRPEYRQQLARSQNNLGGLFMDTGRPKEAETAFTDALATRKRLAGDFPKRPEFRHDLIETQHNLGLLLQTTGRLQEAETAYADNLARCKKLVADFPRQPAFLQALARGYNNLGIVYIDTQRLEEAQKAFAETLTLARQLAAHSPTVPDHQMHVASAMHNLAVVANALGDYRGARRWLDQALPYHQAALKANPREPTYRQFFSNRLFALVESYAGIGDPTAAVKTAEQLRDLGWNPPVHAYKAACSLGLCAQIVASDDPKQARSYADRAMDMLRDAVAKGFRDAARMKQDRFLNALRQREDWRKLLADLEGNSGQR